MTWADERQYLLIGPHLEAFHQILDLDLHLHVRDLRDDVTSYGNRVPSKHMLSTTDYENTNNVMMNFRHAVNPRGTGVRIKTGAHDSAANRETPISLN